MSTNNDILNQLKQRQKPTVPSGFFDHFFDTLMEEIELNDGSLGLLKKSERPSVPDGYFENTLTFLEEENDSSTLDELTKRSSPEVPQGFFANFPSNLMAEIDKSEKPTKSRIIPLWLSVGFSSAAAAILIFISITQFNSNEHSVAIIEDKVFEDETYDTYLSYLDEDEIIDYIVESDIDLGLSDEDEFDMYEDYSTEEIEEFYLELL